ncbi:MAG: hypothetical protein AUJ56_07300 [Zetaproteobacteria bacterium CG1_02_49_23]|nr:MAG: hypothetical protein AUJ56_07300 [Zetaproteobacteria bacterium CG1_02_49_23]
MASSEFHVDARIRLKKATFDFSTSMWEIEAYVNFFGKKSNESVTANDVRCSWFCGGPEYAALKVILEEKCGADLFGPKQTLATLKKEY